MRFHCLGCGGALEYNVTLDKMECAFCGKMYDVGELELQDEIDAKAPETVPIMAEDVMACKVFTCSSCGAEIVINGVEASKFCAYCGQPAISFDRIAGELRPDYIIPFKVTREVAMEKMREILREARIESEKIENFKIEYLRGIYLPYRLYDIEYYDDQIWRKKREGECVRTSKSYLRKVQYTFKDLAIPTASRLNSEITQRLEPFDMSAKVSFDSEYLAGYYADRYDKSAEETNLAALALAKELFDAGVRRTIDGGDQGKLSYTNPEVNMIASSYVMVPAWFMTVKLDGETYTLAMNGQTGKPAGALPVSKKQVGVYFSILSVFFVAICTALFSTFVDILLKNSIHDDWMMFMIIFETILFVITYNKTVRLRRIYRKMRSGGLSNLVRER